MKKKTVFKSKRYTHLDIKKNHQKYKKLIESPEWIKSHGFYPFIHYIIKFNKYVYNKDTKTKEEKIKERDIFYSSHIDRFIYQYYGQITNDYYNRIAIDKGINKVATAYRNTLPGKCNIHFAREALEFIVKYESAFIFIGDFTGFFDNLDHEYLKEKLKQILKVDRLPHDHFSVLKNITNYTYIELEDIEKIKGKKSREMRRDLKYFNTQELRQFKKEYLKKNENSYGIPQGSSISSVYSNVYMIDFDKQMNDYVTSRKGLYRRYCDDLIIVIPMKEIDINKDIHIHHIEMIDKVKGTIPRLNLNMDKTEHFFYNKNSDRKLVNLNSNKDVINYLGFSFDGQVVKIRDKTLFKYYSRAYKKVKVVKKYKDEKEGNAVKKSLYRLYTHLGDKKSNKGYGNFITYARKSEKVFQESNYLENRINDQTKRHWQKIHKRLQDE
ncbi:reverse transcriptase domain-containing protein [Proteiniborus sp. MB09-C3]|uniref:reverse transcriptase domain-containing protein n=1 Tax=Proteiniborus sp. MB09-C3 TaxID=3050072 RepID=UPI002556DB81|nr:reverse transcriptase domain-containing protein [Proteiniborus sp. MB09-C3]WIV12106.1 reverse transcriptase domain-containing protein [Proteiniborus sp. MB09-C3]